MDKILATSLYRKVIKVVATADHPRTQRILQHRWAEYLPAGVVVEKTDTLLRLARKSFEAPPCHAHIQNAFTFLKEARDSMFGVGVLAEWEALEANTTWHMHDGMVLISAVLSCAAVGCATHSTLRSSVKEYQMLTGSLVQSLSKAVRDQMDPLVLEKGDPADIFEFITIVQRRSLLRRRDAKPSDFCLVAPFQEGYASEYMLNLLLLSILRQFNINCTLVGKELAFRWVRVNPKHGKPPVFASWTYGAMYHSEAERILRSPDKHWSRAAPWDNTERRSILCSLLRRQLMALPTPLDEVGQRIRSACKEQILFLLS